MSIETEYREIQKLLEQAQYRLKNIKQGLKEADEADKEFDECFVKGQRSESVSQLEKQISAAISTTNSALKTGGSNEMREQFRLLLEYRKSLSSRSFRIACLFEMMKVSGAVEIRELLSKHSITFTEYSKLQKALEPKAVNCERFKKLVAVEKQQRSR